MKKTLFLSLSAIALLLSLTPLSAEAALYCREPDGNRYSVQNQQQCTGGTLIDDSRGTCQGDWVQGSGGWVCQGSTIGSTAEVSSACLNNASLCSAAENTYLNNQKAVQNDPRSVPLDATAQARLLEQAQQQAYGQAVRAGVSAPAASGNKFCQGGVCTYTPLEPLPVPDGGQSGRDFGAFMSAVFRVLITFGGLFAVVMLTVAGIGYMLSESALDIDRAKDRAKAALWGLVLLLGSWLILNTINPNILRFDLLRSTVDTLSSGIPTPAGSQSGGAPNASAPDQAAKSTCESGVGAYKQGADGAWKCEYAGQF